MTLRAAEDRDLPGILRIWNHAISATEETFNSQAKSVAELDAFARAQRDAGRALLVIDEGGVVGFGHYVQFRGGVGYARSMEHTLYVDAAVQGGGRGSTLLAALEAHARHRGAHVMVGGIVATNTGSIRFHERHGYTRSGLMPEVGYKWGTHYDLVLMHKILT